MKMSLGCWSIRLPDDLGLLTGTEVECPISGQVRSVGTTLQQSLVDRSESVVPDPWERSSYLLGLS
jgi:hypothetical protein